MLHWDESLTTGILVIDNDHKALFGLINNIQSAAAGNNESVRVERALDALTDYAVNHFHREEALMMLCGYASLPGHKKEHDKFCDIVVGLKKLYHVRPDVISLQGLNGFLIEWLIDHIAVTDRGYVSKMLEHKTLIDAASENLEANVDPLAHVF